MVWTLKALSVMVPKLLSHSTGSSHPDLWHTELKLCLWVLLLSKCNRPMKVEGSRYTGTLVTEKKPFSLYWSLWPWPSKHMRCFFFVSAIVLWRLKTASNDTPVIERKRFSDYRSLWPGPLTPRIIGFSNAMRASVKFESSQLNATPVIKRKLSVADGQTDKRTEQKECRPQRGE